MPAFALSQNTRGAVFGGPPSGDRLEVFRLGVNYKFDFSAPAPVVARY